MQLAEQGVMGSARPQGRALDRFAVVVLALALIIRVLVVATAFVSDDPYTGDGPFYIKNAHQVWRLGIPSADNWKRQQAATTSVGPVYPLFLVPYFHLIPDANPTAQVIAARLGQAAVDTATALLLYLIARRLFGWGVGRVALVAQALDMRYVFAVGAIATETLFVMLMAAFMALYLAATDQEAMGPYRWAGLVLGLAVLTRPVPVLFPLVLLLHAWLAGRKVDAQRSRLLRRGVLWLIGVTLLTVAPWLARTAWVAHEFTPISDTAFVHLWRSSRPDGESISTDDALAEAAAEDTGYDGFGGENPHTEGSEYLSAGLRNILDAPFAWLGRIAGETVRALLQPYGTVILTPPGAGVREALGDFLAGRATLGDVFAVPGFWRRLLMWIWHLWGLVAGLAGAILALRRDWRRAFPLAAWAVYVILITAPLLVEPRYLFPAMFVLTVFAAYATVVAWQALRHRPVTEMAG